MHKSQTTIPDHLVKSVSSVTPVLINGLALHSDKIRDADSIFHCSVSLVYHPQSTSHCKSWILSPVHFCATLPTASHLIHTNSISLLDYCNCILSHSSVTHSSTFSTCPSSFHQSKLTTGLRDCDPLPLTSHSLLLG